MRVLNWISMLLVQVNNTDARWPSDQMLSLSFFWLSSDYKKIYCKHWKFMWKCITTLYTVTGSVGECECMSPLAECWPATERRAEEESWESPQAGETQLGSTGTQQHQHHQPEVTCRHHNRYLYTVDIRWLELAGNILALVRSRQRQARSGLYKSSKHLMKTLISMQ